MCPGIIGRPLDGGSTPYEGNNFDFGIYLGTITSVDPDRRMCSVSTMLDGDHVIKDAMWLSLDAHPDGDETTSIPRRGAMGLIFKVHGQYYVWGYFNPLKKGGRATPDNKNVTIGEGDKVISGRGGTRFTLKRSGLLELYCKDTLQRLMFPTGSKIVDLCREYSLMSDGCLVKYSASATGTGNTLQTTEFSNNVTRAFTVYEQKGYVSSDLIFKTVIGPVFPVTLGSTTPTYMKTINISGETTTTVSPPQPEGTPAGFKSVISPDGSVLIKGGMTQNAEITVSSTGDVDVLVNKSSELKISSTGILAKTPMASVNISAKGVIEIGNTGGSTVTISATGEIKIDAVNKIVMSANKGIDIKCTAGPVTVEGGLGETKVTAKGPISIAGMGMTATDYVLCWPTTLSPFTGAPLMPYSSSIKVSK